MNFGGVRGAIPPQCWGPAYISRTGPFADLRPDLSWKFGLLQKAMTPHESHMVNAIYTYYRAVAACQGPVNNLT